MDFKHDLKGTAKQIDYAKSIIEILSNEYPDEALPNVSDVRFWIDNKDAGIDELKALASRYVSSPFTSTFPKYSRRDTIPLLERLDSCVVFDTETTGLLKNSNSEIVEISFVHAGSRQVLLDTLVRPRDLHDYFKTDARALHAHPESGYYSAPPLTELWNLKILPVVRAHHLIAYWADFDMGMLKRSANLCGLAMPIVKATCAMKLFVAFMETDEAEALNKYTLEAACKIAGFKVDDFGVPHTSLCDTLATVELLHRMKRCVEGDTNWNKKG